MTDYYDTKISAFDVCNKAELQHIHKNLAEFMKANNIPGADYVYTGKTGGINFSVKTLKNIIMPFQIQVYSIIGRDSAHLVHNLFFL